MARTMVLPDAAEQHDRQIYNGDMIADPQDSVPGYAVRPNKKAARRKHSTFNIVGALFLLAVVSLLYTSNVIAVNQLAKEVNDLTNRYNTIISANEVLKAEINRKSSLDRISALATELGMTNPKEAPVWIEIDRDKVDELTGSDNSLQRR
ncbi:MAG: septum formation initiator family protein [Bacteroidota bacterium]|nr:septum formation initiator family protein [Bacteroidota bacterium]